MAEAVHVVWAVLSERCCASRPFSCAPAIRSCDLWGSCLRTCALTRTSHIPTAVSHTNPSP